MTVPLARHYVVELHASPERVAQLRRIVAAHLRHWKLELHIDPVGRAVAELLTNVHRHAGDDNHCVIELRWTGRHLTVSVEDNGPRMPRLRTAGGGGLARVAALSDSWGTCPTAAGKVIWFTRSVRSPQDIPRGPRAPLGGLDAARRRPVPEPAPFPDPPALPAWPAVPVLV
ncbi:ATP-binding protein [Streptomyces sp. GMY02]|uniref:ATP-binding protein n=1 Tax=Streptomyces sp. GMY02 TaxID=1333528 RepID=UPI001C2C5CD7|nr:ATP-binding protein [Streptomyces sp. GMY02]QXE33360.1 ATP-binding protein [Streptomyces sp. GMY02]